MFDNFAGSILTWLGIFISGYLIYYGYKYKFVKELFKEKLYKVYLPMFTFLEPYLYKNIKDDGYTNAKYNILFLKEIAEKNYELVKPSIIFLIRKLYNAPKEEFFSI